jgi:DNA topoisomerase-1
VAWAKPVAEKCPQCGSPYMVEKWLKAGPMWQCPNPECKHKQHAPQVGQAVPPALPTSQFKLGNSEAAVK